MSGARGFDPYKSLHLMVRKVGYIFVILDGVVKGDVLGADTETGTICSITDLDADDVGRSLESLQEPI